MSLCTRTVSPIAVAKGPLLQKVRECTFVPNWYERSGQLLLQQLVLARNLVSSHFRVHGNGIFTTSPEREWWLDYNISLSRATRPRRFRKLRCRLLGFRKAYVANDCLATAPLPAFWGVSVDPD
jgi:hypothetical protein